MRFAALLVILCLSGCARSAPQAADEPCRLEPLPLVKPPAFQEYRELHASSELGRALGGRLFFDPRLSASGRVACASCHDPSHAYSIPERLPAHGESGRPLARHPPGLLNVAWVTSGLFWDGGSKNLESQALGPLLDPDELGRADTLPELLGTLQADAQYRVCFEAVFGPGQITIGHVARALAQFERSLVSANTRWDRQERGELDWDSGDHLDTQRVFRVE